MPRTSQYYDALVAATEAARDAYPLEAVRIQRGALLVVDEAVTVRCHENYVASGTTADKQYLVNGRCACPDAQHNATEGRCKHRWAVALYRRALQTEVVAHQDHHAPVSTLVQDVYDHPRTWTWNARHGWAME